MPTHLISQLSGGESDVTTVLVAKLCLIGEVRLTTATMVVITVWFYGLTGGTDRYMADFKTHAMPVCCRAMTTRTLFPRTWMARLSTGTRRCVEVILTHV